MTKRTEALSAAYQQLIRDNGKNITEEQFVCYALDAMQKLDAANTPPDQPTELPREGPDLASSVENVDPL